MTRLRSRARYPALGLLAVGLLVAALYFRLGRQPTPLSIDDRNTETVALGVQIYTDYCASCHGTNLEGQPNWRQRDTDGRLPAPPHDATGHTWHHVDQQLFDLTKFGPAALVGDGYVSDMVGYDGVLTDGEILAVLAYIKSTWPQEIRVRNDARNQRSAN